METAGKPRQRISALVGGISTSIDFPPSFTSLLKHILVKRSAILSALSLKDDKTKSTITTLVVE